MKHFVTSILLVFAVSSTPYIKASGSRAQSASGTFRKLQACVGEALNRFADRNDESAKLSKEIEGAVNLLTDKWMNSGNKDVPSDYLRTLEFDCESIRQAVSPKSNDAALALLREVSADLDVKVRQARNPVAAAETLGASIKVSVKTRRDGRYVEGYLARCNPKRNATSSPAMFIFNNPTNNAERSLPPGNYVLWLEEQNTGRVVASRQITIGGEGEDAVPPIVFDLP